MDTGGSPYPSTTVRSEAHDDRFKTLEVTGWRQFGSVSIDFHPQATVIVGVNGSGKTSLLNILSRQTGWAPDFVGTPTVDEKTGAMRFLSGFTDPEDRRDKIGSLVYDNGIEADLLVPAEGTTFTQPALPPFRRCPASTSPRADPRTFTKPSGGSPRRFKQVKCCSTGI